MPRHIQIARCAWGWPGCVGTATLIETCPMEGAVTTCEACAAEVRRRRDLQTRARHNVKRGPRRRTPEGPSATLARIQGAYSNVLRAEV